MSADQGTTEWLQERCGMVTASRLADLMAKIKTGEAASRANYRAELVAQRLTQRVEESYTNGVMQWGTEQEPFARAAYEMQKRVIVSEVGFIKHPAIDWSGASPDGLVGNSGMVEIKCPNTATHIGFLLGEPIPGKYQLQMLWQMACCSRAWVDYVSFDPRLPEKLQLKVVRFKRDEDRIKEAEDAVKVFLDEVSQTVDKLRVLMTDPIPL